MPEFACDKVCTTADQNDVALLSQVQNGFIGQMYESPEGRMQSKHLLNHIGQICDAIFRHEADEPAWQMVILKNFLHEIAIEQHPRQRICRSIGLQIFRKFFTDGMST